MMQRGESYEISNMVMGPVELEIKSDCAGEDQALFTRQLEWMWMRCMVMWHACGKRFVNTNLEGRAQLEGTCIDVMTIIEQTWKKEDIRLWMDLSGCTQCIISE